MNNLIAICAAIAGTTGILVSLYDLAPKGMWLHLYRGWIIERCEAGHFNMRPETEDFWTDSAELLREAKSMIDRWLQIGD